MDTAAPDQAEKQTDDTAEELAAAESLIEEVSIDGMCGVY
ncbi:mycofactocin precursor MftA [Actinomadura fibrosa]|uniref:Mycofactocin MftA n=1 Tax=Actinomadura fibrosa TaxID=111802 RepID=A0ABW2XWH1_9ACTN|nr:mycofactocin precursor MftA [Actinomadura fibrosa]